ncbi:MAG: hypothetical protein HY288_16370, partial [Planctomycetia bacterium]|nr:hypothetical protein [Planctomycetia bacterium]
LPTGSATIPEIALVKRTNQQGVCKIAAFAYDRMSGRPVWQSGNRKIASRAKDIWVLGAGPFQRGTIYDGTAFAGERLNVPLVGKEGSESSSSVANERVFHPNSPQDAQGPGTKVANAGYLTPVPNASAPQGAAAPAASGPPKAAYTPPPPPPVVPPPAVPPLGPQGNLTTQTVLPPVGNPAAATAGAIQTYNWAKGVFERNPQQP